MFSIIGNGHWGTAIAYYLGKKFPVELIGRRKKNLPGNLNIVQKTSLQEASYQHWVYAAPTHLATSILNPIVVGSVVPQSLLIASKGLIQNEQGIVMTLSDFVSSHLDRVALISGPSFASELMKDKPTFLVGATKNKDVASDMSDWFKHKPIELQCSTDVCGVSFAGAFKNPIAILVGFIDSLFISANMRFALITFVNQVMCELLSAIGAESQTAYGVAGQGDLFMTCSIDESRNRQMGQLLAQGYSVIAAEQNIGSMVEGIGSLATLIQFCDQKRIKVPLLGLIDDVLKGQLEQGQMLDALLGLVHMPAIQSHQTLDA